MSKDLIIGSFTNYDWDKIQYWVNSIDASGFTGDKAMLVYNANLSTVQRLNDKGFKIIVREDAELEVLVDHTLEYELSIGNCIEHCRWDENGNSLVVTATDGYLWCFDFSNLPVR